MDREQELTFESYAAAWRKMGIAMRRMGEMLQWGSSIETWEIRADESLRRSQARRRKVQRRRDMLRGVYVTILLVFVILALVLFL
jgi:hypothetical protein